jgi:hypothetical protein
MTEITASDASIAGETPAIPPLTQTERVIDTFIAPSKTFTDILRSQSWWLPFLLSVIVGYGFLFAVQKQVGWDTVVENAIKQDPKAVERMANQTPAQQAQGKQIALAITKGIVYTAPVLGLLFAAIFALVLWGTINFAFGGTATFPTVFAVWLYGTLPMMLKSILTIITLFAGMDKDSFNINNPVGTNIGFYLPADTPKWLMTLGTSVDVLWIWSLVLVGIGLAIVGKVKRSSGLVAIFGWWFLLQLVFVGLAAI